MQFESPITSQSKIYIIDDSKVHVVTFRFLNDTNKKLIDLSE